MRIIAGEFKKRRLQGPPDDSVTRPIPDQVKESLFNILRGHCQDGAAFDCFAGTGSIGLEALSRGCPRCVFVERDRRIAEILRANIEHCGAGDRAEVVVGDALGAGALSRCPRPVHLVFFDPPYPLVRQEASWKRVKEQFSRAVALLDDTGYAVLRTPWPFFHASPEDAADAGSFEVHHRRQHIERGRGGFGAAPDDAPDHPGTRRGRAGVRRKGGPRPVERPNDDADEMVEIDLSTEEGRALLESLGIDVPEADEPGGPDIGPRERAAHGAEIGAEVGPDVGVTPGPQRPAPVDADLTIAGASGPETHVYAGMALHLYMRAR